MRNNENYEQNLKQVLMNMRSKVIKRLRSLIFETNISLPFLQTIHFNQYHPIKYQISQSEKQMILFRIIYKTPINKINQMATTHKPGYLPWDRNGNRILLQSQLGKTKPSTYNLPSQSHIYGKKIYEDPEKANELMYNWKQHQPSANPNIRKQKDFIETNRKCTKSMLHTAKDFSRYRKSSVEFTKVKQGSKMIPINLPEQSFAYGKPLDLEDPIKLVLANNYGEEDRVERHTFYATQTQKRSQQSERKLSFHKTKNHALQREAALKKLEKLAWRREEPELWKINRFKNVAPRISTNNAKNPRSSLSRPVSAVKP